MYGNGGFALMHMGGGLLGLASLFGIAFLFTWAIKTLKKDELLKWGVLLVAVAIIGGILMATFARPWMGGWEKGGKFGGAKCGALDIRR